MNHSGDAAEQIVRMSLEGVEVAAKISGAAAKEIAVFLAAALKNKSSNLKLKGKARMTTMLKSGKALEIFSVKDSDLKTFAESAKQYGIVYCVLRNAKQSPDGLCDVMVKAEDAPKINRLVERFKFATIDKAKIESEIVQAKTDQRDAGPDDRAAGTRESNQAQPEAPDTNDIQKLLDDLLGSPEGQVTQETPEPTKPETSAPQTEQTANPNPATTAKPRPSEPTLESKSKPERGTSSKPSVKEELRAIRAAKKQEADTPKRDERVTPEKPQNTATTHKQPQNRKKSKPKKIKERS